jgi:Peptide methionine sulfoxide reductase
VTATPTPRLIKQYDRAALIRDKTETATFGLGCFWGPEAQFGAIDGVIRTRVGYAGGKKSDPTYHNLGDHTEVFQVDYDPTVVTYWDLLARVFANHRPNHQTRKTQYQNIILMGTSNQRKTLNEFLAEHGLDADALGTRIERLLRFYPAEDYHQKHSLCTDPVHSDVFDEAGYTDDEIQESPAAAKLNGYASGHDLPDDDNLQTALSRTV